MKNYKIIEDGIITALCASKEIPQNAEEITNEEYEQIIEVVRNKPQDTETLVYKLDAEALVYVAFVAPIPEEPNPFDNPSYAEGYEQAILDMLEMEGDE